MQHNTKVHSLSQLFAVLVTTCLLFQAGFATPVLASAPQTGASSAPFTDCSAVTEISQAECEALVALYNSTNGAGWTNNRNWLQTDTPCDWYGVFCTDGHVTGIGEYYNKLSGNIPIELGSLTYLTYLDLYWNQLTGSIPMELGGLTNLTVLYLDNNQLTGSIPAELGGLTSLTLLHLDNNQLTGSIPVELGSLTSLTTLYLDNNQLTDSIPAELGNLTNLTDLYLYNNQLTGGIPIQLGDLTQLAYLDLGANQLSDSAPAELGNLMNLTVLDLSDNQLVGSIPPQFGNLTNLKYLSLWGNEFSGSIPVELGNLTTLMHLYLSNNQLTGGIPAELGNLTNLQDIWLGNNQLTGRIPMELGNLTNLIYLELYYNQLIGSIPAQLGNLTNLWELRLGNNQLTGSIPAQLGNLTNLVILSIDNNRLIGGIPPQLGNLTKLNYLWLDNNKLGGEIPASITKLSSLTYLSLSCGLTSTNSTVIAFLNNKVPGWQDKRCVTTITADTPDPSVPGEAVNITVTVGGGAITPTGIVNIRGANTNCQITLFGGTGSCDVIFSTFGVKTLTATYNGDGNFSGSWDRELHSSGTERAKNGDFETYIGLSRFPTNWRVFKFGVLDGKDTLVKMLGKASLKIVSAGATMKMLTQTLIFSGMSDDAFSLSYWVKGSALPKAGICQVQVLLYNGATLAGPVRTLKCPANATFNWKKMSLNFTAPADFNKVMLKITVKKTSGTVWFDGVSLMK